MFQELGFPDVFGKPFTQWGAWKMGMAGLNYGMGLAKMFQQGAQAGTLDLSRMAGAAAGGPGGGNALAAAGLGGPTHITNLSLPNAVIAGHGAAQELTNMTGPHGPHSSALPPSTGAAGLPHP
jgi:hypothetical protein